MADYKSSKKTNSLKHRFAQLLLSSSCTASTSTSTTTTTTKLIKHSTSIPQPVDSNEYCELNNCEHPTRPKLDRPHRCAPLVKISIDCSRSAPLLSERKHKKQCQNGDGEGRKCVPASPFSSVYCSYKEPKRMNSRNRSKSSRSSTRKLNAIRKEARKMLSNGYGFSTNSASSFDVTDNEIGLFTSNDDDNDDSTTTATMLSSKRFSSDSSEFYLTARKKKKSKSMKCTRRPPMRGGARRSSGSRGDDRRPVLSVASEEENEGMAVVKRSSDPYMDFRSSMVEMVVQRELKSGEELERLLGSYLTLNSARHHGVILEAFEDIWEAIFGKSYPHS